MIVELTTDLTTHDIEAPDFDGVLPFDSNRPLPFDTSCDPDGFVLTTADGSTFIGDFIQWHDCYADGGEASYVFVELR